MIKEKRVLHEVVEITRDCEIGSLGDVAVVIDLSGNDAYPGSIFYMTLLFPDRGASDRMVHTGADYKYLRSLSGEGRIS